MLKYIFNLKNLVLITILSIIANIVLALYFRMYSYVPEIATSRDITNVPIITVLAVLIVLGLFCFFSVLDYLKWLIVVNACKKLKDDIMARVFSHDYGKFYNENTSYYSSILLNDVEIIESKFFTKIIEILEEFCQMCVMIAFVSLIEWRIIPVILLFALPSVLQPFALRGKLWKAGLTLSLKYESYTKTTREYIENFEIVKIFRKEGIFVDKFSKTVTHLEKIKKKRFLLNATNAAMLLFTMYFIKIGLALFFVNSAINGIVTLTAITALFGFANQIGNPISEILGYIADINESGVVRKKLSVFLTVDEEFDGLPEREISFKKEIRFENVRFTYPNQSEAVLEDFSISFQKGKKYLLLGENGGGKSTILHLLAGYYRDYEGRISFDDNELKNADNRALRDKIALINQKLFVFNGTIRENITLFDTRYDDEQIADAMKLAGLETLLASLPNGVDTIISEEGVDFSGGEKQRFTIARAILANKEILLVDEGTSGLDNITSMEIERNLLSTDKTVIIIAHRIHETISEYDGIVFLNNKQLAAFGNYDELRKNKIFIDYIGNCARKN